MKDKTFAQEIHSQNEAVRWTVPPAAAGSARTRYRVQHYCQNGPQPKQHLGSCCGHEDRAPTVTTAIFRSSIQFASARSIYETSPLPRTVSDLHSDFPSSD